MYDPVCDGLYCGGPIWQSPLFPVGVLVILVGVVGLLVKVIELRREQGEAKQ